MPLFGYSLCVHYFAQRIHVQVSFSFHSIVPASRIARLTREPRVVHRSSNPFAPCSLPSFTFIHFSLSPSFETHSFSNSVPFAPSRAPDTRRQAYIRQVSYVSFIFASLHFTCTFSVIPIPPSEGAQEKHWDYRTPWKHGIRWIQRKVGKGETGVN